jgi:hypothetical protein
MKKRTALVVVFLLAVAASPARAEDKDKGEKKAVNRVFEIRTYYAADGKMDDLNARFRAHTTKLFEKHGLKNVGYWQTIEPKDGKQVLIYILAHESEESAKKNWDEFHSDPDWIKVKEDSEKNGKLVDKVERVFVKATDYSPIK